VFDTPDASVIVTFNTTADTPEVGTPPAPAATNVTTAPASGFPARRRHRSAYRELESV